MFITKHVIYITNNYEYHVSYYNFTYKHPGPDLSLQEHNKIDFFKIFTRFDYITVNSAVLTNFVN